MPDKNKILIATPCYGGLLYCEYMASLISSFGPAEEAGFHLMSYTVGNESFISRARNNCATFALEHDFDSILFIDADISWKPEQLVKILSSDKDIVGGTCPLKALPIQLSFGIEGIKDRSVKSLIEFADGREEIEAKYVPTVFLKISKKVLQTLSFHVPKYVNGHGLVQWDFFPAGVKNGIYESEDWGFCSLARSHGFKTHLNVNCLVNHTGNYRYSPYMIESQYVRQ